MKEGDTHHSEGEQQPENEPFPEALFGMGQIVVTTGAVATLDRIQRHPVQLLAQHVEGKWGDLVEHDVEQNELALDYNSRLFSAYNIEDARFYVITEWDRSVTTVLLPEEY